ncbi:MAG: Spy/CpxP family protein refolding chaperone [Formivibrio sp.]|nr:Spy/CpxP family protein refolding chaperone [Formivibrio sp.]
MKSKRYLSWAIGGVLALALGGMAPILLAAQSKNAPRDGSGGWGYGMGPGMMGGYGSGVGPGMMGGYGSGMMGGYGAYGVGPGMMGGYGMGPGMMGGYWGNGLSLTDEQLAKINKIQDETRKTHWALMGGMMDQQAKLRDLYQAPKRDQAAIDEAYKTIGQLQQQMFDSSVDAQKRTDAVLTKEQQEKLRTLWRR